MQARAAVAFLATGADPVHIKSFTRRALDFNITVVTKGDLLAADPADRAALDRLSFDQKALVDYEVMLRAGLVTGTSVSGFAWNLAVRRAYAFGRGPDAVPPAITPNLQWKDKYSALWGTANTRSNAMRSATWLLESSLASPVLQVQSCKSSLASSVLRVQSCKSSLASPVLRVQS